MKILNFTATEILPALLDKSKCQTIRPAWKGKVPSAGPNLKLPFHKPARFKVGESVQIMWNQRSTDKYFCVKCGKGVGVYPGEEYPRRGSCCTDMGGAYKFFPKLIGVVSIGDVFKIDISKQQAGDMTHYEARCDRMNFMHPNEKEAWTQRLAEKDGFNSALDMFKWFDTHYKISRIGSKPFWVYRWSWL